MTKRLGEILVEAGAISEEELHRSLTAQLVFGGHVGTSLLELRCLDEETLGRSLSRYLRVPYADASALDAIPGEIVRSLPAKLVEKYRVIPLRLEGRTLDLAMIDPKNLAAIDEISFVTGYKVVPWVSPEVRIIEALEKYYSVPRSQRFRILSQELTEVGARRSDVGVETMPGMAGRRLHAGILEPLKAATATMAAGSSSAVSRPGGEAAVDYWEKYGYGRSWRDVAESLEPDPTPSSPQERPHSSPADDDTRPQPVLRGAQRAEAPAGSAAPTRQGHTLTLREVSREFAVAESVEDIVAAALAWSATRLRRAIFMVVRGNRAVGWSGTGEGLKLSAVEALSLPMNTPGSLLGLVGSGHPCFFGPAPGGPEIKDVYGRLGVPAPQTLLIVPIHVSGRIAAYLLGDTGADQRMMVDLPETLALCTRAGLALQIILLRNKILAG